MDEKYILKSYFEDKKSLPEIAQELETYPNKIRRIILKNNKKLRSKSEAQKMVLKSGKAEHPTKGKEASESTKIKISNATAKTWREMSEIDKDKLKAKLSDAWNNRDKEEIKEMHKKAAAAISEAGRKGSKLENFLIDNLPKRGYTVIAHKKGLVKNSNLEPDILVPSLKVLIEIDGPSHFLPVFGEEKLKKTMASDAEKNALFLQEGYCILRVKHICKTLSSYKKRQALEDIVNELNKIKINHQVTIIDIEV